MGQLQCAKNELVKKMHGINQVFKCILFVVFFFFLETSTFTCRIFFLNREFGFAAILDES